MSKRTSLAATDTPVPPGQHARGAHHAPLRDQASSHLHRGSRHSRPATPDQGWSCTEHRVPADQVCHLCTDQLDLFGGDDQ
jgi:hypothetical protein